MNQAGYSADLGPYAPMFEARLKALDDGRVAQRIWARDHTVWSDDPEEITSRLGWLTGHDAVREELPRLTALAEDVAGAGCDHVVVLGMGGSSVGAEILRRVVPPSPGAPRLLTLDSTHPAWVRSVAESVDPARTLFLASSNSGTTLETLCYYKYFRALVEERTGPGDAGKRFVALTSPGTSLVTLATENGFRDVVYNPPDIGSRYSVLSLIGMAPAALAGMDVGLLLDGADAMRRRCGPGVDAESNPGAWLGAALGELALNGRDKMTLVVSPGFRSFGMWAEQMLAESVGKEGVGVVPVVDEAPMAMNRYDNDRFFVFLRVHGDDNSALDATMAGVSRAGHPWISMNVDGPYALAAEMYRWAFATAVTGAVLGVHPFNQPNVQMAKDVTDEVIEAYRKSGRLPERPDTAPVAEALAGLEPRGYVALMPYANATPELDAALATLRRRITERYRVPATVGYGPRALHSTGQMHKGGPGGGVVVQITTPVEPDLPIPGEDFSFGVLLNAQATADLQALRRLGRPVAHLHLESTDAEALDQLANLPL